MQEGGARNLKKHILTMLISLFVLGSLLAGCSSDAATKPSDKPEEEVSETKDEKPDKNNKKKDRKKKDKGSDEATAGNSLAARLCGKYVGFPPEDSGSDVLLSLDIMQFGDNLYAYCGEGYPGDNGINVYTYWATEFIPFDAGDLISPSKDSVKVLAVSFSNMSNNGFYWDPGAAGTITLKGDTVVFEGFTEVSFLCPDGPSGTFTRDERAEAAFGYLGDKTKTDEEVQGLWATGTDDPMYIKIDGCNVYVYQKSAGYPVGFIGGGCDFSDGEFKGSMNRFGYGHQPIELTAKYALDGDTLKVTFEDDAGPFSIGHEMSLHRVSEADVRVGSVEEIRYDADAFGAFGQFWNDILGNSEGFLGVWTAAVTDRDEAIKKAKKLGDEGFYGYVAYSPEWEGLNPEPYYCVTADKVYYEEDADYLLSLVKAKGYKDAYVKSTGKRKNAIIGYTNYGDTNMDVSDDRVILENFAVYSPYSWRPEDETEDPHRMTLIIDKDTVFDDKCETQYFSHYEDGDKPLDWFIRNHKLAENDTEGVEMGLRGLFEVSVSGYHVDRVFGTYWWD